MPAAIKHLANLAKLDVSSVLARWPQDDRYYTVDILQCDRKDRKCQVKFEDGVLSWISALDLHLQFSPDRLPESNIVCCVCDGAKSEVPNEIVMCDSCEQGYHIQCHEPKLNRDKAKLNDEESEWFCSTCNKIAKAAQVSSSDVVASNKVRSKNRREVQTPRTPAKKPKPASASKAKITRVSTPQPAKLKVRVSFRTEPKRKKQEPKFVEESSSETDEEKTETIVEEQMDIEQTESNPVTENGKVLQVTLCQTGSEKTPTEKEKSQTEGPKTSNENRKVTTDKEKVTTDDELNFEKEKTAKKEKTGSKKEKTASNEQVPTEAEDSPLDEDLQGGARVEEMPRIVIEAARTLAEQEVNIGTKEFTDLIADVTTGGLQLAHFEPETSTIPTSRKPTRSRKPSRKVVETTNPNEQTHGEKAPAF